MSGISLHSREEQLFAFYWWVIWITLVQRVNPRHDEIINKYKNPNSWFLGSVGCFLFFWPFREDEIEVTSTAPGISGGMAHLWCAHTVLCPGHQEQLSCAGVGLHTSEGTHQGLWDLFQPRHCIPNPTLLLPLPKPWPPWGHLMSTRGFTAQELSGSRTAAHTVPISTSRLESRWKLAPFCAPQWSTVPNRAHPLSVFDDNIDCNAMR